MVENIGMNEQEQDELRRLYKKAGGKEEELNKIFKDKKRIEEAKDILQDEDKVDRLIKKVIKSLENIPVIGKFFADVPTLCMLIKDYVQGNYTEIPLATIITAVIALTYFVSPIDIIPDVIPFLGKVDDAIVIGIAVLAIHNDLADYKIYKWKGDTDNEKIKDIGDLLGFKSE